MFKSYKTFKSLNKAKKIGDKLKTELEDFFSDFKADMADFTEEFERDMEEAFEMPSEEPPFDFTEHMKNAEYPISHYEIGVTGLNAFIAEVNRQIALGWKLVSIQNGEETGHPGYFRAKFYSKEKANK